MILTQKDFSVASCQCKKTHCTTIKRIVIEPGCLTGLTQTLEGMGITGKVTAVYDSNTYYAKSLTRPSGCNEIILPAENLHADEHGVALLTEQLHNTDVLVAIGSGTIHDIVRYCASTADIPFVSAPTAATVDGFASSVAAMTWGGMKKTIPAAAPILILADLNVISAAPIHLALAGIGDILGKYICLADWEIAHTLTGEYYCPYIADLTRKAVGQVVAGAQKLAAQDKDAYRDLMYALILSGVAMQLAGNSRPASGAEHHISHLLEMKVVGNSDAMHGEKVGAATPFCCDVYHGLAQREDLSTSVSAYTPIDEGWVHRQFGALADGILEENQCDCLAGVTPEALTESWDKVRAILNAVPSGAELRKLLYSLGAKASLEDIGISTEMSETLMTLSPYVRNRLTMMRILRMLR